MKSLDNEDPLTSRPIPCSSNIQAFFSQLFLEPVPGAECTLERVTYHKLGAITLPDSVIHEEDHDSDKKYIYFLNKNGKSIKRFIKIGEKTGDLVEIISGVKMNMKVLRNKPSK